MTDKKSYDRRPSKQVLGKDLKVGDVICGATPDGDRQIIALRPYVIPACVLHDAVAAQHPNGLPGALATFPQRGGMTIFADEVYTVYAQEA